MKTDDSFSAENTRHGAEPAAGLMALGFLTAGTPLERPDGGGKPGEMIGRYELLNTLGEGGFGIVWRARQHEPIQRDVALKVIRAGLDNREVIARFEAERQALALMDHPHIATVHDAGATAEGWPYFVMELVDGAPLTEYCDRRQLTLRERLALFIPVCQAVQHAHQKAVLHRDLKPSNILVAEIDGRPVPKVIDFGIAKALSPSTAAEGAGSTRAGMVIGTPQYMSPEQAGGGPDVDTRSDIYSLGVILCELLTGRTQMSPDCSDFAAVLRRLSEAEPVRPSVLVQPVTTDVEASAARRRLPATRFAKTLRGDLDWITLKALEKDRTRRYETTAAFARDLQRHLDGQTVSAAAPTWHYQLGKFARRHRAALTGAGLAACALVAGTAVSLWQAARAERSRREADNNFKQASDSVGYYLNRITEDKHLARDEFRWLRKALLDKGMEFYDTVSRTKGDDPEVRANRAWALGRMANLYEQSDKPDKAAEYYRKALETDEVLAAENPREPLYQRALAMRLNNLAVVQGHIHERDQGIANNHRALKLLEDLVAKYPDDTDYLEESALVISNLVRILGTIHPAECIAACNRAVELREKLIKRNPARNSYRQALADTFIDLSVVQQQQQQSGNELNSLHRADEIYAGLLSADPRNPEYRRLRAKSLSLFGGALARNKEASGEEQLVQSLELCRGLVKEFPAEIDYLEAEISAHKDLSKTLEARGLTAESEAELKQACDGQRKLAKEFREDSKYIKPLAGLLAKLAVCAQRRSAWPEARDLYAQAIKAVPLPEYRKAFIEGALKARDYEAAVQEAQALSQSPPGGWGNCVRAAELLNEAFPIVLEDASLDETKRTALAESYGHAAVELLQQATKQGYRDIAAFDATSLSERADFKALLQEAAGDTPHSPHGFRFNLSSGPDPGARQWVRDGTTWTETQPSGAKSTFTVVGSAVVDKTRGTEIRRTSKGGSAFFIPDLDTPQPHYLRIKSSKGTWGTLGKIEEMR